VLGKPPASPSTRGVATEPAPRFGVRLPGKPHLALRIRRVDDAD
jgi:hypothetical protein